MREFSVILILSTIACLHANASQNPGFDALLQKYENARNINIQDIFEGQVYNCQIETERHSVNPIKEGLVLGLNLNGSIRNEGKAPPSIIDWRYLNDFEPTSNGFISSNIENQNITTYTKIKTDSAGNMLLGVWGKACNGSGCQTGDVGTVALCTKTNQTRPLYYSAAKLNSAFGTNGIKTFSIENHTFDHRPNFKPLYDSSNTLKKIALTQRAEGRAKISLSIRTLDGSPDLQFGTTGTFTFDPSCPQSFPDDVKQDSAGNLIVFVECSTQYYTKEWIKIFRILALGKIDITFGKAGSIELPFEGGGYKAKILNDDKILVYTEVQKKMVYRFNKNGQVDSSFYQNGQKEVNFPSPYQIDFGGDADSIFWMNYKIENGVPINPRKSVFQVGKFSNELSPSTDVPPNGTGEYTVNPIGVQFDSYIDLKKMDQGFFGLFVPRHTVYPHEFQTFKLKEDMTLDPTYGNAGISNRESYNTPFGSGSSRPIGSYFYPLKNNEILVARAHTRGILLAKIDKSGNPDTSFSPTGTKNIFEKAGNIWISEADENHSLVWAADYDTRSKSTILRLISVDMK